MKRIVSGPRARTNAALELRSSNILHGRGAPVPQRSPLPRRSAPLMETKTVKLYDGITMQYLCRVLGQSYDEVYDFINTQCGFYRSKTSELHSSIPLPFDVARIVVERFGYRKLRGGRAASTTWEYESLDPHILDTDEQRALELGQRLPAVALVAEEESLREALFRGLTSRTGSNLVAEGYAAKGAEFSPDLKEEVDRECTALFKNRILTGTARLGRSLASVTLVTVPGFGALERLRDAVVAATDCVAVVISVLHGITPVIQATLEAAILHRKPLVIGVAVPQSWITDRSAPLLEDVRHLPPVAEVVTKLAEAFSLDPSHVPFVVVLTPSEFRPLAMGEPLPSLSGDNVISLASACYVALCNEFDRVGAFAPPVKDIVSFASKSKFQRGPISLDRNAVHPSFYNAGSMINTFRVPRSFYAKQFLAPLLWGYYSFTSTAGRGSDAPVISKAMNPWFYWFGYGHVLDQVLLTGTRTMLLVFMRHGILRPGMRISVGRQDLSVEAVVHRSSILGDLHGVDIDGAMGTVHDAYSWMDSCLKAGQCHYVVIHKKLTVEPGEQIFAVPAPISRRISRVAQLQRTLLQNTTLRPGLLHPDMKKVYSSPYNMTVSQLLDTTHLKALHGERGPVIALSAANELHPDSGLDLPPSFPTRDHRPTPRLGLYRKPVSVGNEAPKLPFADPDDGIPQDRAAASQSSPANSDSSPEVFHAESKETQDRYTFVFDASEDATVSPRVTAMSTQHERATDVQCPSRLPETSVGTSGAPKELVLRAPAELSAKPDTSRPTLVSTCIHLHVVQPGDLYPVMDMILSLNARLGVRIKTFGPPTTGQLNSQDLSWYELTGSAQKFPIHVYNSHTNPRVVVVEPEMLTILERGGIPLHIHRSLEQLQEAIERMVADIALYKPIPETVAEKNPRFIELLLDDHRRRTTVNILGEEVRTYSADNLHAVWRGHPDEGTVLAVDE